jgi:hypothetical protein
MLEQRNAEAPRGKAAKRFLSERGFMKLPKALFYKGQARSFWSRLPDKFVNEFGEQDNDAIREWLDPL